MKNQTSFLSVCDDLNDAIEPLMGHLQTITPNLQKLAARSLVLQIPILIHPSVALN